MSLMHAELPGLAPYRNGLPFKPYVYRGTVQDEPEPEPEECWCGGDMRGYRKHIDRKEQACQASRDDVNLYMRSRRRPSDRPVKVHLDRGSGRSRCGVGSKVAADRADVDCENCLNIDAGRHNLSRQLKVQPCGTARAYRRHLRNGEPVDDVCREAENRRAAEAYRSRKGQA